MHDRNIELKPSVVYFIHTGHFANEYIGLKEKKMSLSDSLFPLQTNLQYLDQLKKCSFMYMLKNMGPKMETCGTPLMPVCRHDVYSLV